MEKKEKTKSKAKSNIKKSTPKKKTTNKITSKKKSALAKKNDYSNIIVGLVIILIILGVSYFALQVKNGKVNISDDKYVATADEKKFKKEYESLNGEENINKLEIIDDNNIEYIELSKALEILDSGSGVILFGYASDNYSRNAIPVLLEAVNSSELDTIYYVNVRPDNEENNDIRDLFELKPNNKPRRVNNGSEGYSDLLIDLANYLKDYTLTTDTGKKVNTGEKRLNTPTVVAVLDGTIVGFHEGVVESNVETNGILPKLTDNEKKELNTIYSEIITKYLDDSCPLESEEEC